MASTRNGLDALAGHNFSDGDLRASASPWSFRRQRQRQAASNYAVMLGRLTAIEEQRGVLAARHADFVKQFECQTDIVTNLALRVNMLEKVYVFLDWQKIGSLVNGCMPHATMHTAADSSTLRTPPPAPCQPEPEMSPMKDVVPDDAGTFLAMRQNGGAATELFDIFDSCSHVAVQTDGTGDIAKADDFKLTGSSDGASSSIGTKDGRKNKKRTKQVKCTEKKAHSYNAEKTAAVTAAADAGEGKKEKLEDIVIGIEENENERNDEDDEEYNEEEDNEEEDNEEQDSEEEAKMKLMRLIQSNFDKIDQFVASVDALATEYGTV